MLSSAKNGEKAARPVGGVADAARREGDGVVSDDTLARE